MKKILCMSLALLLLLSALVSCSKKTGDENPDTAPSDTGATDSVAEDTSIPLVPLPEPTNYNYKFRILMRSGQNKDFFVDEVSKDIVDQAVWARNQKLKTNYGVELELKEFGDSYGSYSTVAAILESGENAFDLLAPHGRMASTYALYGACTDWYKLPYCNLTYPWWSQGARECFTINDRLYFVTGDISHLSASGTYCVMFNKAALQEYNLPFPYDMVKEGTWTFEVMSQYALQCAKDEKGDGDFQLHEDRMGYVTYRWAGPYCSFFSSGNRIVKNDANGAPYISIAENETAYKALEKFYALCNDERCYLEPTDSYAGGNGFIKNGLFVFYDTTIDGMTSFRETDLEYGIVPYPKTSEHVEGYVSHSAGAYSQFIVPYTADNLERTSVVLEFLCQEGQKTVRPAYFENVVEKRSAKDMADYEMLSYIVDARIYDMGYFCGTIGALSSMLCEMSSVANPTADSFYGMYAGCVESGNQNLQKLLEAYSK